MYGVHDQVVELARGFLPTTPVHVEGLDPFKVASEGTIEENPSTSASDAAT